MSIWTQYSRGWFNDKIPRANALRTTLREEITCRVKTLKNQEQVEDVLFIHLETRPVNIFHEKYPYISVS